MTRRRNHYHPWSWQRRDANLAGQWRIPRCYRYPTRMTTKRNSSCRGPAHWSSTGRRPPRGADALFDGANDSMDPRLEAVPMEELLKAPNALPPLPIEKRLLFPRREKLCCRSFCACNMRRFFSRVVLSLALLVPLLLLLLSSLGFDRRCGVGCCRDADTGGLLWMLLSSSPLLAPLRYCLSSDSLELKRRTLLPRLANLVRSSSEVVGVASLGKADWL